MKPSERIDELATKYAPELSPGCHVIGTCERTLGLIDYLDEQHDLERRRNAFHNALAMIGPGCPVNRLNEQLRAAGLGPRVVGDSWLGAKCAIIDEAREAGLL
jgi:hypothetical protein